MKKTRLRVALLGVALLMGAGLAGCGNNTGATASTDQSSASRSSKVSSQKESKKASSSELATSSSATTQSSSQASQSVTASSSSSTDKASGSSSATATSKATTAVAKSAAAGDLNVAAIDNGDISSMVGTWKNGAGDVLTINADGTTGANMTIKTVPNSEQTSGVPYVNVMDGYVGAAAIGLYQAGFKNPAGDQSDTSKARLTISQQNSDFPASSYYYRQ
ncbi:DUF6287 domain-containing protein [Furfurilactobacillus sp. WILCCON 0119]